jgi:hypothetical protein
MTSRFVDFRVACDFMETVLPREMPLKQRRTMQARFYSWLYHHGTYRLVLTCPYCKKQRGRCRCPQLGYTSVNGKWVHQTDALTIIHWRISTKSLLAVDVSRLNRSSANERRLGEFISYVKQRNAD